MSFGIPVRNGLSVGLLASTFLTSGSGRLVPRLTLNFLTGAPLDPRITFSRTTNATLVDATGRVTYAPNNLVLRSEEFDNAAWTKVAATVTSNAAVAPNGTTTADKLVENTAVTTGHYVGPSPNPSVALGQSYVFSVYAKAGERTFLQLIATTVAPGSGNYIAGFDLTNGTAGTPTATATSTITDVGDGWYRCSIAFPISAGTSAGLQIRLALNSTNAPSSYTGDGTSGAFIWGAQFEQVTYQTLPSTYVQTVASAYYGPRFDYNPVTLAPRGLLIEEQRVNLFTNSEVFENAAWVKGNSTVTANATVAPDGTTTADKLVENTATGAHQITQQTAFVSGTSYTWSFYVKAAERSVVRVLFPAAAFTSNLTANFDLATGAWRTGSPTPSPALTLASQDAGNGWYRIAATATATASLNQTILLLMVDTPSGTGNYTGNGTSGLFIWGAQLEVGAFATSYIPTVASTVTRAADVATMTGANFSSWYNASEGTFVSEAVSTRPAGDTTRLLAASDGTANNSIRINVATIPLAVVVAGVTEASFTLSTVANAANKYALGYKVNDVNGAVNGVVGTTDTSVSIPVVDRLEIGRLGGGASGNLLCGYLRTITFYATRLTNAQLQALTS